METNTDVTIYKVSIPRSTLGQYESRLLSSQTAQIHLRIVNIRYININQ